VAGFTSENPAGINRNPHSINSATKFSHRLMSNSEIISMRKASLARLLARRVDSIFLSDFEQGEIGPGLFRHACLMGLEGMVSKHRESNYRSGRSDRWIKVKNRQHPPFARVQDQF
jgi:ATP-dependent DNA ligase